ncbi:MAG TPA: hypothetical protein VMV31_14265 [Terriglobales bacterium]|nr:hypothetical protein [Terriglobales bacterium]
MRTTVDLPDELYRRLKVRASLTGSSMKELLVRCVDTGMRSAAVAARSRSRPAPPVIVPATGKPIRALSARALRRLEESEDETRGG